MSVNVHHQFRAARRQPQPQGWSSKVMGAREAQPSAACAKRTSSRRSWLVVANIAGIIGICGQSGFYYWSLYDCPDVPASPLVSTTQARRSVLRWTKERDGGFESLAEYGIAQH